MKLTPAPSVQVGWDRPKPYPAPLLSPFWCWWDSSGWPQLLAGPSIRLPGQVPSPITVCKAEPSPHVIDDIALSLTPELSLFDLLYLFLVAAMGMRELG